MAVETEVMAIRNLIGATSVQYKKFAPKNPIGIKKLNMKMKNTAATDADLLVSGNEVVMQRLIMHRAIPPPLTINNALRPNLSTVKNATKQERNFHVKVPPERMRET